MFLEYRIESAQNNCILLHADTRALIRAFQSGTGAPLITFKLSKKQNIPCLTVEVQKIDINIVQDVPVKVMSPQNTMREPQVKEPEVRNNASVAMLLCPYFVTLC